MRMMRTNCNLVLVQYYLSQVVQNHQPDPMSARQHRSLQLVSLCSLLYQQTIYWESIILTLVIEGMIILNCKILWINVSRATGILPLSEGYKKPNFVFIYVVI